MQNEMQRRVKNIHANFTLVDAHIDLLFDVEKKRRKGERQIIENYYMPEFKEGGANIIVSSIYITEDYLPELGLRKALDQISAFYSDLDESKDKIKFIKSYSDVKEAMEKGIIGILLSFEGVDPLMNDIGLLRLFYELGVRGVGITWSRRNFAGDGCSFSKVKDKKNGLSQFGEKVVEEAERLGMMLDVSHLNEAGFWDVIKIASKPVIASHSNCRALYGIMRNLSDEQIKAIAATGGVIGINGVSSIVAEKYADVKALADHVDHLKAVAGIEHIGLGFDFCDKIFGNKTDSKDKKEGEDYDVIDSYPNIHKLTEELISRGYSDNEIRLIYGENFLRVYKTILR
ncbi:Membrane dipeptidase [Tepidanaerobacter acetatoxydans Re1]|uniref:Membrane dipeptidase n=1 Tax=Tepidanaerobacter acetatoxydans (strain DSM 21804 / JCM 16047 / Re1) TaxID=1209989 RepID=F4LR10_TEPAE|nr:dipeptidase [Tepidanaerobacter acetatoxydans]AEE92163.1 Membrane dipeptidase [Tepidanaerobacter acetatoxydans Re1]CDI40919.1 Membrane dipeptidase [Tepidanaerobacter acetatoxydans Re1]